ncbi:MAG: hypothetical protein IJT35_03775 [Paludibacteraceae bacterium]|nr:hypothetical protein [Paludibacteraceae bacterium]
MKKNLFCLLAVALGLQACIITAPVTTKQPTTVVVKQPTKTVVSNTVVTPTKTVYVNATSDLSYDLDLQAVAIAFAEARTLEEFEWYLNDYSRQISNLDLNRDGYVDYLRVVEQIYSGTHLIIIQDVYAYNAYQDVATIVVENNYYTQIVGNPYFYGTNYIIEPTFVSRPVIYSRWGANYKVWSSPYSWNHYPSHHQHWAPKPQQTYYSHIDIYITNHYYCSDFGYSTTYHYNNYPSVYQSYRRNDYGQQYPDRAFSARSTTIYNGTRATNARQLSGTRDITSTRTISSRGQSSSSTSGTRASSTTTNTNSGTSTRATAATRTSTSTQANTSATTSTRASANSNIKGKVTTTSRTANSTTTTTSRTSGNTTRTTSTTRMVDGDKQITTNTRVQASPTQTKTTTTTTTKSPIATSTRKVTTTTKTDRASGQQSIRSNVSERSSTTRSSATRSSATRSSSTSTGSTRTRK